MNTKLGVTKRIAMWVAVSVWLAVCTALYVVVSPAWAAQKSGTWIPAGPMNKARAFFVAVELLNGNVLAAGGFDGSIGPPIFADSEIYNWHAGTWTPAAPMNVARAAPVAVRLEDGRVLVIGGFDAFFNPLNSAEIYDPSTNTWSLTGSMNDPRAEDFTAVLLPGRKVLVAGGYLTSSFVALSSAEIYDEASGTWARTASMNVDRGEFATVELHDGRVLVCGGTTNEAPFVTATAEIFDPATQVWTLTGSMNTARNDHAGVLQRDGRVLVAGGAGSSGELLSAEIFDPLTGQWTTTGSMTSPRNEVDHAGVLLRDGQVLVPGGFVAHDTPQSSADLYDPKDGSWTQAGSMSVARAGHVAVLLRGNRGALVMGGLNSPPAATASVDIFR